MICQTLLHHRSKSVLKQAILKAYIGNYISEILQKCLEELINNHHVSELKMLYDYFAVIGALDDLQKAICSFIVSQSVIITSNKGIPALVELIVMMSIEQLIYRRR